MFGVHIPSISDVKTAVTGAASTALHTTEDLGASAVSHAASLGRSGLDLGRTAVDAVSHVDVQKVGATVTGAIGKAEHAAESGIQTGVLKAGQGVHAAADFARSHIPGDNPISNAARGAITAGEDYTRFDIGVVGGVGKAAVGLVGSAGQLGVMATEYQISPSARAAINDRVVGGAEGAAKSVAGYADSVAHDPTRVFGDAAHAAGAAGSWAKSEVKSAEQAIKDGHGPESFGMQVGNAATYLIPVGGEVRLAVEGGEVAARGLVSVGVEGGTRALANGGREAIPAISDLARAGIPTAAERTGVSEAKITEILQTPKSLRPDPTYLSEGYQSAHLSQWGDGAVRVLRRSDFDRFGTLGPDGAFTIPARDFATFRKETGGDLAAMERKLGLEAGALSDGDTMVVHIEPEDMVHLRIPSGRERGANENWLPGGYTTGGQAEAAMDLPKETPFTILDLRAAVR